ncbi:MAG TPA: type 4a pilus biogenesis protein PilO [Acidimicrobiales bacterium]|nr:type 4a pilus biogenesis protein PilO [Acidimicrobiales bacterium]
MNRRVVMLAVVGALVLMLLWYMVLWSPANSKVSEAKERREAAEEQATQLRTEIQRLKAAASSEATQRARLVNLKAGIPDSPDLGQFILDTNDAAVRSAIDFISVAPSVPTAAAAAAPTAAGGTTATTAPPVTTATTAVGATGTGAVAPASGPAEIRLALQVQGGYYQVLDFLNRITDMPRIVVIDSLNVTGSATGRLTVALTARMFTRAVPPEFGGVATPTTTTTTAPGGATTTTAVGGATTTTAAGATTTTAGVRP